MCYNIVIIKKEDKKMKYSVGYKKNSINNIWDAPMIQFETYETKNDNKHLAMKEYQKKYPNKNIYYFEKNA